VSGTTSVVPLETSKIAGFTGCGKTRPAVGRDLSPAQANRIIVGLAAEVCFPRISPQIRVFPQLFSPEEFSFGSGRDLRDSL